MIDGEALTEECRLAMRTAKDAEETAVRIARTLSKSCLPTMSH